MVGKMWEFWGYPGAGSQPEYSRIFPFLCPIPRNFGILGRVWIIPKISIPIPNLLSVGIFWDIPKSWNSKPPFPKFPELGTSRKKNSAPGNSFIEGEKKNSTEFCRIPGFFYGFLRLSRRLFPGRNSGTSQWDPTSHGWSRISGILDTSPQNPSGCSCEPVGHEGNSHFSGEIPTFLGDIPGFLTKFSSFLGEIPSFLGQINGFLA